MTKQTLFIQGIKVEALNGSYKWEQQVKQLLCIDVEFAYDVKAALATDAIEQAIDYTQVVECIIQVAENHQFNLFETLAEQVAAKLLIMFPMEWLRLRLTKPGALAKAKDVGIIVERYREVKHG